MKKLISAAFLIALALTSAWSLGADVDLSYSATLKRKNTGSASEEFTGSGPAGIELNTGLWLGSFVGNMISIGANASLGADAGYDYRFNRYNFLLGDRTCSEPGFGLHATLGPAMKVTLLKRISVFFSPGLEFNFSTVEDHWEAIPFTQKVTATALGFNMKFGAHVWIFKHFGATAGFDLTFPFAGTLESNNSPFDSLNESSKNINGGFISRIHVGAGFKVGK